MPTVDTLHLALSCVALVSFASLGVVALPWTRDELDASETAWRTLLAAPKAIWAQLSLAGTQVGAVRASR